MKAQSLSFMGPGYIRSPAAGLEPPRVDEGMDKLECRESISYCSGNVVACATEIIRK